MRAFELYDNSLQSMAKAGDTKSIGLCVTAPSRLKAQDLSLKLFKSKGVSVKDNEEQIALPNPKVSYVHSCFHPELFRLPVRAASLFLIAMELTIVVWANWPRVEFWRYNQQFNKGVKQLRNEWPPQKKS